MVKPGYKQTEIGEIPEDWDAVALNDFATKVGSGITPKGGSTVYQDNGRPFVRSQNVGWGQLRLNDLVFIDEETHQSFSATEVRNGDVLLNITGASIGRCAIADQTLMGGNVNQHVCIIRTKPALDQRFVSYLLLSSIGQKQIDSFQAGGNREGLNFGQIRSFLLPKPIQVTEQQAIAKALSDVDEQIVSLEKLIAKKRDIKTGAMQQLLTGKKRLPGFNREWNRINMQKDANLSARIGWQALTTKEYLDSGDFCLVTGTDFVNGRVNWNSCHYVDEWRYRQDKNIQLKEGDVLLTKDGTIGKVGYVENLDLPATLNSGVFVIRPRDKKFYPLFLFYILRSRVFDDFLAKITAGSTITHLYQKDLVNFEFLAPETDEQKEIAQVLDAIDKDLVKQEERLRKAKAIKQGMMQELLTGRTRLIDVAQIEHERMHGT
ncbi:MAG: restriction endonuclease subunit S [Rhodospirillales bacterium]|nr:restriction endonuclease subunit S [Rhodospirillales bacterium]